jgi:hypothetical protein
MTLNCDFLVRFASMDISEARLKDGEVSLAGQWVPPGASRPDPRHLHTTPSAVCKPTPNPLTSKPPNWPFAENACRINLPGQTTNLVLPNRSLLHSESFDPRGRQENFAELVHPAAGLVTLAYPSTAELIKLIKVGHLDFELQ